MLRLIFALWFPVVIVRNDAKEWLSRPFGSIGVDSRWKTGFVHDGVNGRGVFLGCRNAAASFAAQINSLLSPPMTVQTSSCLTLLTPCIFKLGAPSQTAVICICDGSRIAALLCDSASQPVSARLPIFSEASSLTLLRYRTSGTYT